eukprot:SAG22_NODE_5429_length_1014_cov_1.733333_2_plen_94_part_00
MHAACTPAGITPEEFVEVCEKNHDSQINEFVFNQILAVDDFTSFKKMMVKRNIELNVQALRCCPHPPIPAIRSSVGWPAPAELTGATVALCAA